MAIQNFLSGGYIGKLGETVGQRWRNKRTIRTYVGENKSRTPKQIETREQFKLANQLSQEAMNFNRGAKVWQSPTNNEWSLRVGTAMRRIRAGLPIEECIPYFPDVINLGITIDQVEFAPTNYNSACTFQNHQVAIPNARTIRFTFAVYDKATRQMTTRTLDKTFADGELFEMTIPASADYFWVQDSWVEGHSLDDNLFGDISITMTRQSLASTVSRFIHVLIYPSGQVWDLDNNMVNITGNVPNEPVLFRNVNHTYRYTDENGVQQSATSTFAFQSANNTQVVNGLPWALPRQYKYGDGIPEQSVDVVDTFFTIRFNIPQVDLEQEIIPIPQGTAFGSIGRIGTVGVDAEIELNGNHNILVGRQIYIETTVFNSSLNQNEHFIGYGEVLRINASGLVIGVEMPDETYFQWNEDFYMVTMPVAGQQQYHRPNSIIPESVNVEIFLDEVEIADYTYNLASNYLLVEFQLQMGLTGTFPLVYIYYFYDRYYDEDEGDFSQNVNITNGNFNVMLPWNLDHQYLNDNTTGTMSLTYPGKFYITVDEVFRLPEQPQVPN